MRRCGVVVVFLCVVGGMAFAQETDGAMEALMGPGDFGIYAGVGWGFFWGAVDVSGGVEVIFHQIDLGEKVPLTFGGAARVSYYGWTDDYLGDDYHYAYLGGGVFATAHLGFTEESAPENVKFLANTDWYVGLGPQFTSYSWGWTGEQDHEFRIGIGTLAGVSYFLTPNFAINLEGGYYGWYGSGLIGVLIKF
ncbi:hypothetical protein [Spirochaeta thermophila]|uniref:Outer membrane protein beta-barrel domain-containing protein n=1 Tax=Winmispira thermophila (strain ATCC 49972 / DSM 6192 / RI 19.B1) TaxID=665571 RepID=E0RSC8_WINT6|nr:hypothetical protein [Spirochaeta thermophila]ADN01915.1 hypothetical protein STHERM_c09690 [Spirochaeta thermophila DSM 6192]